MPEWIEAAVAVIGAISGANSGGRSTNNHGLSLTQAKTQAANTVNPQWDNTRNNSMNQMASALAGRGMYGQAPGDSLMLGHAAELENNRESQVNGLANSLYTGTNQVANQTNEVNAGINQNANKQLFGSLGDLGNINWDANNGPDSTGLGSGSGGGSDGTMPSAPTYGSGIDPSNISLSS